MLYGHYTLLIQLLLMEPMLINMLRVRKTVKHHVLEKGAGVNYMTEELKYYSLAVAYSYLYPFSTAYYRKFGYENCVNRQNVTVDLGLLSPRKVETDCVLAEQGSDLRGAIRELDAVWEQTYNMAVRHGEKDYALVTQA